MTLLALPAPANEPMPMLAEPPRVLDPKDYAELLEMLTYKRPAGSIMEEIFIEKFLRPFDPHQDGFGNIWVQVGDNPNIMWSSHTDTVHHKGGMQKLKIQDNMVTVKWTPKKGSPYHTNCLGADDTAGVWLMMEMIRADVPGVYIFHREEECGGRGSNFIAKETPKKLEGIEFAIALDRKGTTSVITHQGSRTCSDKFAASLAMALNLAPGDHAFKLDDSGVFTDTANYTDVIGECTNLSVGYYNQHGPRESLDLDFVLRLRDALIAADFSKLEAHRKPGEWDDTDWMYGGYGGGYGRNYGGSTRYGQGGYGSGSGAYHYDSKWELGNGRYSKSGFFQTSMTRFVKENPELVADVLEQLGYDVMDLEDLAERYGTGRQ